MKLSSVLIAAFLCFSLLTGVVHAESGVTFDVNASPVELTLQDTLTISVAVTITGDDSVFDVSEPQAPQLENFEHISTGSSSKRFLSDSAQTVIRTTRHLYKPLAPGTAIIPSLSLDYVDKRTGRVSTLRSSELRVTVIDTSSGSGKLVGLIILALIVTIVVATSIIIYRRMQRKRMQSEESSTVDRHAEEALEESLSRASIQLAHGRRFEAQTILTDAILAYLRQRYRIDINNRSVVEIAKAISASDAPNILISNGIKLVEWNEGLKFSGLSRSEAELKEVICALEHIVELSHP